MKTDKEYLYYFRVILGTEKGLKPGLIRAILRTASWIYGGVVRFRNLAYRIRLKRQTRVNCPVISVGNLTAGGTGKTPMVEYLAGHLQRKDLKVAVLSRGYKGMKVTGDDNKEIFMNDEALALSDRFPDLLHFQNPNRVALARKAVFEHNTDTILLDDGFQHRPLARDLDIVLIDSLSPFGLGYLVPRGLLREPVSSLKRAGYAVITRCNLVKSERIELIKKGLKAKFPNLPVAESIHEITHLADIEGKPKKEPSFLAGKKVYLMCAIGNPTGFQKSVEELGGKITAMRLYPDHFIYREEHLAECKKAAEEGGADFILTTHKDAVKLRRLPDAGGLPVITAMMHLRISAGETRFIEAVDKSANVDR